MADNKEGSLASSLYKYQRMYNDRSRTSYFNRDRNNSNASSTYYKPDPNKSYNLQLLGKSKLQYKRNFQQVSYI